MVGRHTHALKRQSIQPSRTAKKKATSSSPQTQFNPAQLDNEANHDEQSKSLPTESSVLEQVGSLLQKNQPAMDTGQPSPSTLMPQLGIQAKMTIGESNDKYEQEADRVSREVVQRLQTSAVGSTGNSGDSSGDNENDSIQRKPLIAGMRGNSSLQMPPPISRLQAKPAALQRREAVEVGDASPALETAINRAQNGGQPLDTGTQTSMGQAMGANFSGVRVHTDTQSDRLNRTVQARAFTTGSHIFFKQGEYNPGSRGGQELIAHELTHVVQQNGSGVESNINRAPQKIIQRNRLRFADEDGIFAAVVDVADTAAAHMGTGGTGPTVEPVSKLLGGGTVSDDVNSDILMGSGSANIGGGVSVAHVGGSLGAATNIFNTCRAIRDLISNVKSAKKASAEIKAAEAQMKGGEAGLKTSVSILKKNIGTAKLNIGEESSNIVSGLNGITNGITTLWAAFSSAPGAVAAVSGATFLAGAALGSVLGTISAVRLFTQARRKAIQIKEIEKTIGVYEALSIKCERQVATDRAQLLLWEEEVDQNFHNRQELMKEIETLKNKHDRTIEEYEEYEEVEEEQRAAFQGAIRSSTKPDSPTTGDRFTKLQETISAKLAAKGKEIEVILAEMKVIDERLASIKDPDPLVVQATHENISAKGQQIPLIAKMVSALTTSAAQHERSKKSKMTEGTMSAVGAVGAGAITLASAVASTAVLATPIGWGIVGAVAIGALIYGIGKHVHKKIRTSNVKRMNQERGLLDLYINNGTIQNQGPVSGFTGDGTPLPGTPAPPPGGLEERKLHKWHRKNFPTATQKGWFNKLISKKKTGKRTIQQRLEEIDAYMTKHAVTEEKSDVVYYGIVEALTTAKGDEEVTLDINGDEQTITLKEAITQLLASKSISASDVVDDVGSGHEDVLKTKISEAMKLNEMI